MPAKISDHKISVDDDGNEKLIDREIMCHRILDLDPAIRVATVIDGTEISGFASRLPTGNALAENNRFKDRIGFLARFVTEIGRETEPLFGPLESVSFALEKLKLVTVPISATRSIGVSVDKSANSDLVASKIKSRTSLNGR